MELVPLCPAFAEKRLSVTQDDLDEAGHVRLFGVVVGEKGVLLHREKERRKKKSERYTKNVEEISFFSLLTYTSRRCWMLRMN